MVKFLYCWREGAVMPMLEEHEWRDMERALHFCQGAPQWIPQLAKALIWKRRKAVATETFLKFTGRRIENYNAFWHLRASIYGRPCPACGKPFRTPKSKYCVECGFAPESKVD
jgi:hypothetical protein